MRVAWAFLLVFLTIPAAAAAFDAGEKRAAVERMMEVSGLNRALSHYPAYARSVPLDLKGAPEANRERLGTAFRSAIVGVMSSDIFREDLVEAFTTSLDDADIAAVADFYTSGFGLEVLKLEQAAQEPDAVAEREGRVDEILASADRDPDRKKLVADMREALQASENGKNSMRSFLYAMLIGMVGTGVLPPTLTDEQIAGIVEKAMPDTVRDYERKNFATYYATYEKLPLEGLRAYVAVLRSAPMQKFYGVTTSTLNRTMSRQMLKFGNGFLAAIGVRDI